MQGHPCGTQLGSRMQGGVSQRKEGQGGLEHPPPRALKHPVGSVLAAFLSITSLTHHVPAQRWGWKQPGAPGRSPREGSNEQPCPGSMLIYSEPLQQHQGPFISIRTTNSPPPPSATTSASTISDHGSNLHPSNIIQQPPSHSIPPSLCLASQRAPQVPSNGTLCVISRYKPKPRLPAPSQGHCVEAETGLSSLQARPAQETHL